MEAIVELITAIVEFIIEVTLNAAVLIFLLIAAIFSSRYRRRLSEDWNKSALNKFCMASGLAFYTACTVIALWFWGRCSRQGLKSRKRHLPHPAPQPSRFPRRSSSG